MPFIKPSNKGPRLGDAVQQLDDILQRMQAHQHKKSAMLRPLHVSERWAPAQNQK